MTRRRSLRRMWPSHEHRHASRQGSRQHGRPRLQSTKLIEIVETGKQMLMTRGSLTTFSIANDVAKYFAIILRHLHDLSAAQCAQRHAPRKPLSAILAAVIFNAVIIVFLIRWH